MLIKAQKAILLPPWVGKVVCLGSCLAMYKIRVQNVYQDKGVGMTSPRRNGLLHDFKEFIARGNVVDLAVAVIIGAAFGRIISSLVEDIIMPGIINPILSQTGTDWREATIGPGIRIGSFFGTAVDFLIIALVIFLIVRAFEKFKRKEEVIEAEAPAPDQIAVEQELTNAITRLTAVIESRTPL